MSLFADLVQLFTNANGIRDQYTGISIQEMINYIQQEDELRFLVDGTNNFGHQATTVNVMKRIIDTTQYTGAIKVIYRASDPFYPVTTAQKLAILLPNIVPDNIDNITIAYGTCNNITFLKFEDVDTLPDQIRFGFTGGADTDEPDSENYAIPLKVSYFLRLQPYLWNEEDNVVERQDEADNFSLSKASSTFQMLAYKFQPDKFTAVPQSTWTWYGSTQTFDAELKIRTKNAQALYDAYIKRRNDICLWPVYGMHHFTNTSGDITLNLLLSAYTVQKTQRNPVVIIHFSKVNECYPFKYVAPLGEDMKAQDRALSYLAASITKDNRLNAEFSPENLKGFIMQLSKDTWPLLSKSRLVLLDGYNEDAGSYVNIAAKITGAIADARNNDVLIISMGPVPQDAYNFFFSNAVYPGIFEGQGTSSLVISQGRAFFQIPREGKPGNANYPGLVSAVNYDPVVNAAGAAIEMIRDQQLSNYYTKTGPQSPAGYYPGLTKTAGFILDIFANTPVYRYFYSLGDYYQKSIHDKLMLGLVGVDALILVGKQLRLSEDRSTLMAVAADPLTLDKVYEQLTANWSDGKVNLFAALPGTYLTNFFVKVTNSILSVSVAKEDIKAEKDKDNKIIKVTVSNATTPSFLGITMNISLIFTAPNTAVITEISTYVNDTWSLDGIPWIAFKDPGFMMKVNEGGFPVQGGITGTIEPAGLHLQIQYPVENNTWLIAGSFEKNYPGIAMLFQMAGGINLVQVLPAPLNGLAGFGLKSSQLQYNAANRSFGYMSFEMSTPEPWKISQTPLLQVTPTVNVIVYDVAGPNRKIEYQVSGEFTIGKDTVSIAGGYPDFYIYGGLSKGTIELSDLLKLFGGELDLTAAVTQLDFAYRPAQKYYQLGAALDKPFSIEKFSIDKLSFNVESNNSVNTVSLGGTFTILPQDDKIIVSVSALYSTGKGWQFEGRQTGGEVKIGKLLSHYFTPDWNPPPEYDYGVKDLYFKIATQTGYWEMGGATAEQWHIPFLDLYIDAKAMLGKGKKDENAAVGMYGNITADLSWYNIDLKVFYDFAPGYKAFGIRWGLLEGKVETKEIDKKPHQVATLHFTQSTTVGSLVETMVTWATGSAFSLGAPWNILNEIPLNNLALTYDFTTKQVSFEVSIGTINLGFAQITGIKIEYKSGQPKPEDNGVWVNITGKFWWKDNPDEDINWDAAKPETTPAPSGQGNKYLDLRLLAMGQHVTLPCFKTADTVQKAIACMYDLKAPEPGKVPDVTLDSNSSWLTGMDFGILKLEEKKPAASAAAPPTKPGYFITAQVVFNDPTIYALRLALEGEPARILKGLDFQIMYRKISDSVGVYQAEIALPEIMRRIEMGQFNITLPVFGIAVYTNGDFQIDIGFPWKADFSRSFTFQTLIWTPIGIPIPVMGSAGFYFGKLSSATTDRVPKVSDGTFNPVLVFGLGIQFGIGYDFNVGILKAGFSLTAVAILEGILAKWNPYPKALPGSPGSNGQLEKAYYFWFRGTAGIIGKLYGTIDFSIIRADVNIDIRVLAQMTFAPYEIIELSITASVSVSVSVRINLGLFKITISFSFSARIQEGVTIKGIGGTPPWTVVPAQTLRALQAPALRYRKQLMTMSRFTPPEVLIPNWSNLQKAATPDPLTGYMGLGLTMAMPENGTPTLAAQQACYVTMLLIESVAAPQENATDCLFKALNEQPDTSFEKLCKQLFRWIISTVLPSYNDPVTKQAIPYTAAEIDQTVITHAQLQMLFTYLSDKDNPVPIPVKEIEKFLTEQFLMTAWGPTTPKEGNATFFPIPLAMNMSVPDYGGNYKGVSYTFGGYNETSSQYIADLRMYFNDLAIKVQEEMDGGNTRLSVMTNSSSVGNFVFGDYFLLICRQMVQAALDSLKDFKYYIKDEQRVDDIVKWVNENGNLTGGLAYSAAELFTDNATLLLNVNKGILVSQSQYQVQTDNTFNSIAALTLYNKGFSGADLALLNSEQGNLLQAGIKIHYPGKDPYATLPGQSLQTIADKIGVDVADLIAKGGILTLAGLLAPAAVLQVPAFTYMTVANDTLRSIGARFNLSQQELAAPPANGLIAGLFDKASSTYLDITHLSQFEVGELIKEIQYTQGLQHVSGMASRYYMAGLRLPTKGIKPLYKGMWVTDNNGQLTLPDFAGLYALTGQQFPVPVPGKDNFNVTFNRPVALPWLQFAGATPDQLTIAIAPGSDDANRIIALRDYATKNRLNTGLSFLGTAPLFKDEASTYPFTTEITWNSPSSISFPYGGRPAGLPALRLWQLPETLLQLPAPVIRKVNPRVSILAGQYNEGSQEMENHFINHYGYASVVSFTVKKVPEITTSPSTKTLYEVTGASGSEVAILEKMVSGLGSNDQAIALLTVAFAASPQSGTYNGLETGNGAQLTMGIAQVNLSTETRPDGAGITAAVLPADTDQPSLLNTPTGFIRLLWEASITRAGGFYLYYYDAVSGGGLPDRLFNDKNEATLSLLVLYAAPADTRLQNNVTNYMNMLATGEAIDTSATVLFAQAAPEEVWLSANTQPTLRELATGYYDTVAAIATGNKLLPLRNGITLSITEGVYEVGPAGSIPGGNLTDIAAYFGTTADAIKAANPKQTNWNNPLPLYTSLYLPALTLTVGTSKGGNTLSALAQYYGQNLGSLAAHNQDVAGLFADGGTIVITGGPITRTATVPAGVVAVQAIRPVPDPIPEDPKASDYAPLYLKHQFSLLSFSVVDNAYFNGSKMALPAGPLTTPAPRASANNKIAAPRILTASDNWEYKQAIPYNRFSKQVFTATEGLPAPEDSPYKGLGDLLQADFTWQDLYGNRLITTLSQPTAADATPLNQWPILTGYTDTLIGLAQWPSIASSWQVTTDGQKNPLLQMGFSFDNSTYQGLITASAIDGNTIETQFTEALDAVTALAASNYTLDNNITVEQVAPGTDKKSVRITTSALPPASDITLTINNIQNSSGKQTFSGYAQFVYKPAAGEAATAPVSSVTIQAARDRAMYKQLWYQLTDPNGIAYTVPTTLVDTSYTLSAEQVNALVQGWLADIYLFLDNRAQGSTTVAAPATDHILRFGIDKVQLNKASIFKPEVSFSIERTGGAIMGDFESTGGIKQVKALIPALTDKDPGSDTRSLVTFARQFEAALSTPGVCKIKIATGVDRNDPLSFSTSRDIWVVKQGLDDNTSLAFRINNPDKPAQFAPRPVSTKLENRPGIPIYDYNTETGIDFKGKPSTYMDFTAIDTDQWVKQFFADFDHVLSPEFVAAIQLVDEEQKTTYLDDILANKKLLADIVKQWMIAVFKDEYPDTRAVQEVFKQQLLVALSNAYNVRSAIEFNATVVSDSKDPIPPRLFGNVLMNPVDSGHVSDAISLTSPKLNLATSKQANLPFLLSSPQLVRGLDGEVLSYLDLDLTYAGAFIEHQIGQLPGIEDYEASTWLSFVVPDTENPFVAPLGQFPAPLLLRSFPATPSMINQASLAPVIRTTGGGVINISDLLNWGYTIVYAQSFHYPQDKLHFTVNFNVGALPAHDLAGLEDAFADLAEFITVFPAVQQTLSTVLAAIYAGTTDPNQFRIASTALRSFNDMVTRIVNNSTGNNLSLLSPSPQYFSNEVKPYEFYIKEDSATIAGPSGPVQALIVGITGEAPEGIGTPVVQISGYTEKVYAGAHESNYCYYYVDQNKNPLPAVTGQAIAQRTVVLPGMNILARQDSYSMVQVIRNDELKPGMPYASSFRYTTGNIGFADPCHPTNRYDDALDISTIGAPPGQHNKTTLVNQLTNLFTALLEKNSQDTLSFLANCQYTYSGNSYLDDFVLPVMMQPMQSIRVKQAAKRTEEDEATLTAMIAGWAGSIRLWFNTHAPATDQGCFTFSLTVFSNLTKQPMPLLQLTDLTLPLLYITDMKIMSFS
ncbi:hypothetical protein HB364_18065 [Pseudoflavitalea sp. X16]|uniref:hypothetical protein n=1 Tax=Paraflavitalea devenefica TaxID=2716334 RepID=UPI0014225640|nr:hypothetical protein [Paraflavitalea devenefica]NII27002.1 hypothetical protein [Paraflavitalea devenefica]